ncbi:Cytochrome P450 [Penicillium expansum]|nr:Cytochrome P450 [Penicillium expansum]
MRTLWWMCSLAHLLSFVNVGYGEGCCICQWCDTCLPVKVHDAPGVGFDLTPSYGTAAVHYYNGTVVEIVKVLGSPEYLELMTRLATVSEPLPETTFDFISGLPLRLMESLLPDELSPWRDWWRWLNTRLGRPVKADDVEIISDLLQQLKVFTEKEIFQPLDRVAVADPGFQSLSSAKINAALRILHLRTWGGDSIHYPRRLLEGDAVYAVNGYGLCTNYLDVFDCMDEFEESPGTSVLFVSYNRNILYASILEGCDSQAFSRLTSVEAQLVDYGLGLDRLLEKDEAALWDRLRSQLQILPREYEYPITHLLLAGESVTHPRFLDILRDSMSELSPHPVDIKLAIDPTFAAARGAALYSRRRQEVQADCTERSECEETRKHERLYTYTQDDLRSTREGLR